MIQTIQRSVSGRLGLLALALALVGTGLGSLAVLTDTLKVTNTFSVRALDLQANGQQSITASFALDAGNGGSMQPLVIRNAGNTELRYSLASTATGTLAPNLMSRVFLSTGAEGTCTTLDPGILSGAVDGTPEFGAVTPGQQAGDRVLAAGASETLCAMHEAAAAATGSQTATQIMTFSAESTS